MTAAIVRTILATAEERNVAEGVLTRDRAKLIHEADNHSLTTAKAGHVDAGYAQEPKAVYKLILERIGLSIASPDFRGQA